MTDDRPSVQVQMQALRNATQLLVRAEKNAKSARAVLARREEELSNARRTVKRVLEAMQPDLPSSGELPS